MAASSLLLLRLSEYLRTRKSALAEDAANGCREERRNGKPVQVFPWREQLVVMLQATSDALLLRASVEGGERPKRPEKQADPASAEIQGVLMEAWLVRNAFLRSLNRFQGDQSIGSVDFTALEMTEVRQEAVQEFDRAVSETLAQWITGASHVVAVPASAVSDLYDGMRAIQGLLQLAADSIPAGAKAHVSAAAQQLSRLAASAQSLLAPDEDPLAPAYGIAPPSPVKQTRAGVMLAPLDVQTFVSSLAETARPAAEKKGLFLEALCNPGPRVLKTDGANLHRATTLLLHYMLSFTETGGVTLVSGGDHEGNFTLEMRDTSPGVPPEILARLL